MNNNYLNSHYSNDCKIKMTENIQILNDCKFDSYIEKLDFSDKIKETLIKIKDADILSNVISWLTEHNIEKYMSKAMYKAIETGNLKIMEWLLEWTVTPNETIMDAICFDNNFESGSGFEVFKWLNDNNIEEWTDKDFEFACISGNVDIVDLMYDNKKIKNTKSAFKYAIECKHMDVVKWFHENNIERVDMEALSWASGSDFFSELDDLIRYDDY